MPFSDDRIFQIAMAVLAFELSIPIASSILPTSPLTGASGLELLNLSLSNWGGWLSIGVSLSLALGGLLYSVPIGAVAYAGVFGIGSVPLSSVLTDMQKVFISGEASGFVSNISGVVMSLITLVFVWTFIKLAR